MLLAEQRDIFVVPTNECGRRIFLGMFQINQVPQIIIGMGQVRGQEKVLLALKFLTFQITKKFFVEKPVRTF